MIAREYTTDDPHGECIEGGVHEDTPEARTACDEERDELRAERIIGRREWELGRG